APLEVRRNRRHGNQTTAPGRTPSCPTEDAGLSSNGNKTVMARPMLRLAASGVRLIHGPPPTCTPITSASTASRHPGRAPLGARAGTQVALCGLEHDPEKWVPVFGKDHAPPIS